MAQRGHVGHRQQRVTGAEQLLQELLGVAQVAEVTRCSSGHTARVTASTNASWPCAKAETTA
jgi:hypothetical protein